MKTILRILERAGDFRPTLYLKIENPPYMALVIEATPEPGPTGLLAISIAHYGEQNGDLMRDPEMCFELSKPPLCEMSLSSFYFRNDYLGVEQYSRYRDGENYIFVPDLHRQVDSRLVRSLRSGPTPDVSPLCAPSPSTARKEP
jgi:hypothetical protein